MQPDHFFDVLPKTLCRAMKTAIVVSTYNNPGPLRMCLLGLLTQTDRDFEVLVADDGSDRRTAEVLAEPVFAPLRITHVWHADDGFRLSAIRNRAIAQTEADYLIFIDGDCIVRDDFVASHVRHARPNYFLAGSRVNIPRQVHQEFSDEAILDGQVFDMDYLVVRDPTIRRYRTRLARRNPLEGLLNLCTHRHCVFAGSNASAWKSDLVQVNGFDEHFAGYGSEDRDIGVRMYNNGVRAKYLKFSLVQIHLDHRQAYLNPAHQAKNRAVFRARRKDKTTWVPLGVDTILERA